MTPEYDKALEYVQTKGAKVAGTREVLGGYVHYFPGEMVTRAGFSPALAFAEALQLIAGTFDPDVFVRVAPNAAHHLLTEQMAYGPKVGPQMPAIVSAIRGDPDTRRAVAVVARPEHAGLPDLTCTLAVQWFVRDGLLSAMTTMRSWDLVLGLPYDVVSFGALTQALAHCTGYTNRYGQSQVHAGSTHVYRESATKGLTRRAGNYGAFLLKLDGVGPEWDDVRQWAFDQLYNSGWESGPPPGVLVLKGDDVRRAAEAVLGGAK